MAFLLVKFDLFFLNPELYLASISIIIWRLGVHFQHNCIFLPLLLWLIGRRSNNNCAELKPAVLYQYCRMTILSDQQITKQIVCRLWRHVSVISHRCNEKAIANPSRESWLVGGYMAMFQNPCDNADYHNSNACRTVLVANELVMAAESKTYNCHDY